ncbi:1,4-alpha-glucan branching protein GlgB [Noviherbaspirillum pedocola]|uniref:1,4-alpha-glucan branching enzyme GlgB n=1 Tax=Noviherbaspirillum pedocola TaxID=2801341 RepID=A0A934WA74_9BURK|nr:1,4-alpha-glucan branching protein GlgB [Noviherbaspirillum pedocola]MBK4738234.1 1,4-alpha-glucan branching protein GlgB [Noviherbaspirillum pedocola]
MPVTPIPTPAPLDAATRDALAAGRLRDPFSVLGPHPVGKRMHICTWQPGALRVQVVGLRNGMLGELPKIDERGIFSGALPRMRPGQFYRLRITWPDGNGGETVQDTEDPYSFGLLLNDHELGLLSGGVHYRMGVTLGAQPMTINGVAGTRFAVWAPNAQRVSVVGDFNGWDGRRHPMRLRHEAGIWELFIPRIGVGERYKYEMIGPHGNLLAQKADPIARATELPPSTASVVAPVHLHDWTDAAWMAARADRESPAAPMSIYEVHAASWQREDGRNLNWEELAERLIPYVVDMGFTHIEFLPLMEHPFGGSWGYQPLAQFAPSARFGPISGFARFVDLCHAAGIGVIIDWVPAHFPSDAHGLAQFDGTALFEHADPREGFHKDWNTLIYNFGRNEVRDFLISGALEWLERYHVDGLRVDAVASMLYRDYSRQPGEWLPNVHGGRENLEAVAFLRELNRVVAERCPGVVTIAEESTAWPGVTAPLDHGGLGFTYKWNMGWMHDTLDYIEREPIHRRHHHHELLHSISYAWSERYVLPISHDEVVYGKGSLLAKMPGDDWQQRANLRAYLAFMWSHPGKKLLFMGSEFGQRTEWNHDQQLPWELLDDERHLGIQLLVRDLNRVYDAEPSLHTSDADPHGFRWVVGDDVGNSVHAFLRIGDAVAGDEPILVVLNLTPVVRHHYRLGVPAATDSGSSLWRTIINTDAAVYGGSNVGNPEVVSAEARPSHGFEQSLELTLPPLSAMLLKRST